MTRDVILNAMKGLAPGSQLLDPSTAAQDDGSPVILNAMKDLAPGSQLLDPSTSLRMTVSRVITVRSSA
jgi:hypothetical protein